MKHDERDSEEIRKLILDTLHDIRDIISIDFKIETEQGPEDGENIIVRLPPESSGISKPGTGKSGETYTRSGAKIVFNQIFSNGTEVSYRMSHIEGLTQEPRTELRDKVDRPVVTRQYIMEKVLAFLEEVVQTEK